LPKRFVAKITNYKNQIPNKLQIPIFNDQNLSRGDTLFEILNFSHSRHPSTICRPVPVLSRGATGQAGFAEVTILLFSVDPAYSVTGTPENNKKHALRAFEIQKHRVAIDIFHLLASQQQMELGNFLCVLCGSAVNIFLKDTIVIFVLFDQNFALPRITNNGANLKT
jgi:hypothetical protein